MVKEIYMTMTVWATLVDSLLNQLVLIEKKYREGLKKKNVKRQFGSYYRKALRVIDSCETTTQLHGAKNFTEFVINSVPTYAKDDEYYRLCSRLRQKITKKMLKLVK